MSEKTVVRTPGEGDAYWMLGGLYEVLLSSDETNGEKTVIRFTIPVGMGPPPHSHDQAESVYVVDGTATFHVGGELIEAGPGSLIHFPPGTVETWEPKTTTTTVATYTPGGLEKFFAEAGEPAPRREVPPTPTSPPDVERMSALGERYGLHIQAPPG
jgi:quercetin dioxygenase-like cupin family protein